MDVIGELHASAALSLRSEWDPLTILITGLGL